jgi:hypothetical protein
MLQNAEKKKALDYQELSVLYPVPESNRHIREDTGV